MNGEKVAASATAFAWRDECSPNRTLAENLEDPHDSRTAGTGYATRGKGESVMPVVKPDSSPIRLLPSPSHQEEKAPTNDAPCDIVPFLDSHTNRDRFTAGRDGVEIQFATSWPLCCEVGVNAIKGRIAGRIGVAPVVSACIWAGLGHVRSRSLADDLLTLKETFSQKSALVPGRVANAVQSQFKGIVFNLPKTAGGKKTDTFKIKAPELVRNYVAGLSGDLGVPVNHLSILAVMATLIHQPDGIINPDHRREMEESLADFVGAVETQVRIVRAIMKEFGLI